tara:strand:- start:2443 stop:4221 length:1779 start_codon:yes stop_codon:yes gene_type:complete
MKIKKTIFQLIIIFSPIHLLFSQDAYETFIKGKKLFYQKNYSEAIFYFDSLGSSDNEFKIYSIYYSGLCDFNLNKLESAQRKFEDIKSNHLRWPQIDEVNYWLVRLLLEKNEYEFSFKTFSDIKSNNIKNELYNFLDQKVEKINDFNKLRKWHEIYPNNNVISKYFGRKLLNEPLDKNIINKIQNILSNVSKENLFIDNENYIFKIAVLLPFMYNENDNSSIIRNNKFIMDLYNGMRIAINHLDSLGVNIKLYPYDTKRDPNVVKDILKSSSFNKMDLIIGPLYTSPVKLVSQYCLENKIFMINPLSNNNEIIDNNKYSMLFLPSNKTLAIKAAYYARKKFNKNKNAIIFYENNKVDSLIASIYENEMESYGFNFIYKQKVNLEDSRLILDSLTNSYELMLSKQEADSISEIPGRVVKDGRGIEKLDTIYKYEEKFYIDDDSIGHVFTVSSNSLLSSNTLSAVDVRNDTISVLGFDDWLNYDVNTFDQLKRLDVSFISTKYINFNSEISNFIKDKFINSYAEVPSENLFIGFGLINMIGKIVDKYGSYFQFGLRNENLIEGDVFESFQYNFMNDNQFVPILKIIDSELKIDN